MENIYFTNWTEEDFIGKWGGQNYLFPKMKRSPIILGDTAANLGIRLKFAKDLTVRELFKMGREEFTEDDVLYHELMQKCLEPLPIDSAKKVVVKTGKKKAAPLGKKDLKPMDIDQEELKSFAGAGDEDDEEVK